MGIRRRTEEKIVEILQEAEKSELSVADICRTARSTTKHWWNSLRERTSLRYVSPLN